MKKFTLIVSMLILSNLLSAQWIQQNPNYPDSMSLYDVFFIDEMTGWTNGAGGDPSFYDGNYYRTYNGGTDWYSWQDSIQWLFIPMQSIYFTDYNNGFAVWNGGSVYHTGNGGSTWESGTVNNMTDYDFTKVFFSDSLKGWILGYRVVSGMVFRNIYTIIHSNNGGIDWVEQSSGPCMYVIGGLFDIGFYNENIGWAVGDKIASTLDGGATWDIQDLEIIGKSLSLISQDILWIAGYDPDNETGSIMRSTDGGVTWSQILEDTIPRLNDIVFANSYLGWAVGDNGTILHTSDQGQTWEYQESGTSANLYSISFVDQEQGWICGDSSIILHTENGGIVGIEESNQKFKISIYPNPANSILYIQANELYTPVEVWIYNQSGQIALHLNGKMNEIDVSTLPSGIYILEARLEDGVVRQKFVKK